MVETRDLSEALYKPSSAPCLNFGWTHRATPNFFWAKRVVILVSSKNKRAFKKVVRGIWCPRKIKAGFDRYLPTSVFRQRGYL